MNAIIGYIVGAIIFIVVVLVIRGVVCWYWKINKIVDLLQDISNKLSSSTLINNPSQDGNYTGKNYCSKCNKIITNSSNGNCTVCGNSLSSI